MAKALLVSALSVLTLLSMARAKANSVSDSSAEIHESIQQLSSMCLNNNRSGQDLWEFSRMMGKCFTTSVDEEKYFSDYYMLSNETRATFFPRYCPQIKKASFCVQEVVKAAKPCLEESEFTFFHAAADNFPRLVDLICKNDGEVLLRLDEKNYDKCLVTVRDIRYSCVAPLLRVYKYWDMSHLAASQCEVINEMKQCTVEKLNVCQAPELISMYDQFHDQLIRNTPCRENTTNLTDTNQTKIENNEVDEE